MIPQEPTEIAGFKIKPLLERNPTYAKYMEMMVAALNAVPRNKIPHSTVQAKSTQAILERPKEKDREHWERLFKPLEGWLAVPEADLTTPEGIDKAVNRRQLSPDEVIVEEKRRRSSKNSIGQSLEAGISEHKRDMAIQGMIYSPPAKPTDEDLKRIKTLNEYSAVMDSGFDKKVIWKELSLLEAIKHWLKGGEISKGDSNISWRDLKDYK